MERKDRLAQKLLNKGDLMDGNAFKGIYNGFEGLYKILIIMIIAGFVLLPCSIWKLVEIIIWLCTHIHFT